MAEREEQAVKARAALRQGAQWTRGPQLPDPARIHDHIKSLTAKDAVIGVKQGRVPEGTPTIEATDTKP